MSCGCAFVRLTTARALRSNHFSGYAELGKIELASAPKSNKHPQLIRIDLIPMAGANPASFTNAEQFTDASDVFLFGFKDKETESEVSKSSYPGTSFNIC